MKTALEDKVAKMEARAERDLAWGRKALSKCEPGSVEHSMASDLINHLESFLATIRRERESGEA